MNYRTIFLVVLALVVFSESSLANTTATGLYNSDTEKCCLGSVYSVKKPPYQDCCGSDFFDNSKELCCNDIVFPLVAGEVCCGNKTIHTDSSVCCDDEEAVIDLETYPFTRCCGTKAYDERIQSCCYTIHKHQISEGKDLSCCREQGYDPQTQACCINFKNGTYEHKILSIEGNKTLCCGETIYDPNTETCCADNVAEGESDCCYDKPLDEETQICCGLNLFENNGNSLLCCGNTTYNIEKEVCCFDDSGNGSWAVVKKTNSEQTECCGIEPYDEDLQICCSETQIILTKASPDHDDCCGNVTYEYTSKLCCNATFYPNFTTNVCCGDKPMDARNICCGGKIEEDEDMKYCCRDSEFYNSTIQLCCIPYDSNDTTSFIVIENPDQMLECCGLKSYDTKSEICCEGEIFPNTGNKSCCGNKTYDTEKELCCIDNSVFCKKEGQDYCCTN